MTVRAALAGLLQSTKGSFNLDGAQFPFASQSHELGATRQPLVLAP
jgi:hypothetical protein